MFPTLAHFIEERVLLSNILLQNMFCISSSGPVMDCGETS
jgi:hypothetical protein